MWSFGCILVELFDLNVLPKTNSTVDYLDFILKVLGMPNKEVQSKIKNKKLLKYMQEKQNEIKQVPWKKLVPNAPKSAIDLLSKLFTWDP